jgi:hypothetical protein
MKSDLWEGCAFQLLVSFDGHLTESGNLVAVEKYKSKYQRFIFLFHLHCCALAKEEYL